ncbi:hypothetical protein FRB90_002942, partial [Tulasnella sp. 427]
MVQEIESEIRSMEVAIHSLLERVIQRKKARNSLVKFNKLPLEISSYILWLSVADPWRNKLSLLFLDRVHVIASVCSAWHAVVEVSPRFWSVLELKHPLHVIEALLEKSKCSPLQVKCFTERGGYDCGRSDGTADKSLSHLTESHSTRIRSLALVMSESAAITELLSKPAPRLEELKLHFAYSRSGKPLKLFGDDAPSLRDVGLENAPVKWDCETLRGLESLRIKAHPRHHPTRSDVIKLLQRNPGLEKLILEDVGIGKDFWDAPISASKVGRSAEEGNRVMMNNLRKLRFWDLPFEIAKVALGTIDTPRLETFHLKCHFHSLPVSDFLGPELASLVVDMLQRSAGDRNEVRLKLDRTSVGLDISPGDNQAPSILIRFTDTVRLSAFEWILKTLLPPALQASVNQPPSREFTSQVSLTFTDGFNMAGNAFLPFLDRLTGIKVKRLTIASGCLYAEQLIRHLGDRGNSDGLWLLPDLTEWVVGGFGSLAQPLLAALQARYPQKLTDHPTSLLDTETFTSSQEVPMTLSQETSLATERPSMKLEVLNIEGLQGIDKRMEEMLEGAVSKGGICLKATRPAAQSGM